MNESYVVIQAMLDKYGVEPMFFCNEDIAYSWRVGEIDNELFVERVCYENGEARYSYYDLERPSYDARNDIYENFVSDFATCFQGDWVDGTAMKSGLFETIASPSDPYLVDYLSIFLKSYATFLNDLMYWFALAVISDDISVIPTRGSRPYTTDERLTEKVVSRIGTSFAIFADDMMNIWNIAKSHDEIWYMIVKFKNESDYINIREEYNHFPVSDTDGHDALTDSIRSCFMTDECEVFGEDEDIEGALSLLGLSYDELKAL